MEELNNKNFNLKEYREIKINEIGTESKAGKIKQYSKKKQYSILQDSKKKKKNEMLDDNNTKLLNNS